MDKLIDAMEGASFEVQFWLAREVIRQGGVKAIYDPRIMKWILANVDAINATVSNKE